jgi:hypothetical protein
MSIDKLDTHSNPETERILRGIQQQSTGLNFTSTAPTLATVPEGRLIVYDDDAGTTGVYLRSGKDNLITLADSGSVTNGMVKQVYTQTGASATGNTTMPNDDSIPQNTEGDEYMTLAITPTSSTNRLKIDVVFCGATATSNRGPVVALFQDTTANALAAAEGSGGDNNFAASICFTHYMTAGTTSATTFKVRAGSTDGSQLTFNGQGGTRLLGGVMASSITITEISV